MELGTGLGLRRGAGGGGRERGRACRHARPCERCDMKWTAEGSSSACGVGRLWMYRARSVSHSCKGTEGGVSDKEEPGVITR